VPLQDYKTVLYCQDDGWVAEIPAISGCYAIMPTRETALAELTFSRRRIAHDVKKVLQAAIANAENNHQLDVDRLYVKEATVGRAFVMKRFHTRGRGRSARIEKHFAHLTVIVRERPEDRPGESA